MEAYFCENCPLAFEIGGYLHWDLSGGTDLLVCTACGVMHRLIFHEARGCHDMQTGTSELFVLPNPIRQIKTVSRDNGCGQQIKAYEWPYEESDWIKVGVFENRQPLDSLTCHHCQSQGKLVSHEKPENEFGLWPVFKNEHGELYCPVCRGLLESLYFEIIN